MAKKKDTEISTEERLEQALVPENEQPYNIPENWVWTKFGAINKYVSKTINPSKHGEECFELYSVPSFEANYPEMLFGSEIGSSKQIVAERDVLVCKINPRINRVWTVSSFTEHRLIASSEWIVFRNTSIHEDFIKWYFTSKDFRILLLSNVSGVGGSLMRAQPKFVNSYSIPLPPLNEQIRIAKYIDEQFTKLDYAKELIRDALDSFENRKAAILHKAFTGELTKKWREENGISIESWEDSILNSNVDKLGDGIHGTPIYNENGEFYFVNGNNLNGKNIIIKSDTKKVDFEEFEKHKKNLGDNTVFVSINGTLGKTAFYNYEPIILGKSACYFNVQPSLSKYFIRYYLESKEFIDYANDKATGSTIKNLSLKSMRELPIKLPRIEEQNEIVKILDDIIEKENSTFDLLDLLDNIDLMKKSILARAFRGDLGTNDPTDENAIELLKKIIVSN